MAKLALPAALRGHELIVLGAGAGVLIVGATMLRNRVPIDAGGFDAAPAPGGIDPSALASLLTGATSTGAAAALAGFAPGAELGAAGLGVASQAFDSAAGLASRALDSQSYIGAAGIGLAQSLGQGLTDLLPSPIYPTLPPPVTTPTPVPAPPPPAGTNLWGSDVPATIRAIDPSGSRVAAALRKAGTNYGTVINVVDLANGLTRAGGNFWGKVDPIDVTWLLNWAARH